MAARILMPIDTADILTLAQCLSPAYPVGAFAYSHGLETAIADGLVADAEGLNTWITEVLQYGGGRADAVFLAAAFNAKTNDELAQIDARCRAFASSRERLAETTLQGAAFAKVTAEVWGHDLAAQCYPVAVGTFAAQRGLPLNPTLALFLQAFAGNLVSVGVRMIPLGQTDGQRIVQRLAALCDDIAIDAHDGDLAGLSATAFLADVSAMRHETLSTRIFRT